MPEFRCLRTSNYPHAGSGWEPLGAEEQKTLALMGHLRLAPLEGLPSTTGRGLAR